MLGTETGGFKIRAPVRGNRKPVAAPADHHFHGTRAHARPRPRRNCRRLKADATEGPWECEQYVVFAPDGETIVGGDAPRTDYDPACADAVFIANARNDPVEADVDSLLAEVRRLQGLIAEADRRTGELWDDTGEDQVYE
jgi:hypothetical protein